MNEHRTVTSRLNLIYSISHLYFPYKLFFVLHFLLDNGAKVTPRRRSVFFANFYRLLNKTVEKQTWLFEQSII